MSKMNFNGKKETAGKNECQNNEEATNLHRHGLNEILVDPEVTIKTFFPQNV